MVQGDLRTPWREAPWEPVANAVRVAKLTKGETEEEYVDTARQAGAEKGGEARADALSQGKRRQDGQASSRSLLEDMSKRQRRAGGELYGRTQPQSHS